MNKTEARENVSSARSSPETGFPRNSVFNTTHWTVVVAAAETESPEGKRALEELCRTYWYPLYAYTRRRGFGRDEAADITQGFFQQVIEKKLFKGVDRNRGRLRAYLLGALQHFLNNHRRDAKALKRGGGFLLCSTDLEDAEGNLVHEPSHNRTPEKQFEQDWVVAFVNRILDLLRMEQTKAGAAERFALMSPHLMDPETTGSYAQLARELRMTEGAVKTAIHRLRRRYAEIFRRETIGLVASKADVEEEIRHMAAMLASQG